MDEANAESADPTTETTNESQEQSQENGNNDFDARLDERVTSLRDELAKEFRESQEELYARLTAEPEEDEYPLSEDDDGYEEQEAQRLLDEMVERKLQERLQPHLQEQEIERRDMLLGELEEQYPELADKKIGAEVLQAAVEIAPEKVQTRQFARVVELVYKARKADERARRETPAQQPTVQLEQGGGAAPSQAETDEDLAARIVNAGVGSNPLL